MRPQFGEYAKLRNAHKSQGALNVFTAASHKPAAGHCFFPALVNRTANTSATSIIITIIIVFVGCSQRSARCWLKNIASRFAMTVSRGRAFGKLKRRFKVRTHGLIDKKFPPPPVEVDGQAH